MKAIVIDQYGTADRLRLANIAQPQLQPQQLLVKVHASSIHPIDWKIRSGQFKRLSGNQFPRVVGSDLAGDVVAIGSQVTQFQPGDAVFLIEAGQVQSIIDRTYPLAELADAHKYSEAGHCVGKIAIAVV